MAGQCITKNGSQTYHTSEPISCPGKPSFFEAKQAAKPHENSGVLNQKWPSPADKIKIISLINDGKIRIRI